MRHMKNRRNQIIGRMILGVVTLGVLLTALCMSGRFTRKRTKELYISAHSEMASVSTSIVYEDIAQTSTESVDVNLVSSADEESTVLEPSPFDGRFIANITDTLNVRAEASTDSEIVGKMYPGCVGEIVGVQGDWTQITSGNVSGYVKTEFIVSGQDAEALAEEYGKYVGTVTADTLKVRREASTDSEAIALLEKEDEVFVTETLDGWYGVLVNENWEGYVSAEFLSVEYHLDTAVTIEEEQARIAAAQQAEEEARQAEAQAQQAQAASNAETVETTQQEPTAASYDDAYLLACLVSMEAGYEPYEGQLAVANVVLNRLRSGYYGSTIYDVIYAKGQFPSVNGSVMTGYLTNGPLPQAQQAANEALSGVNNIGGYMGFINVKYANYASYSSYTIIGNHCFH